MLTVLIVVFHIADGNDEIWLAKSTSPIFQKARVGPSAYVVVLKHMKPTDIQEAFDIFKSPTRNAWRKLTSKAISRFHVVNICSLHFEIYLPTTCNLDIRQEIKFIIIQHKYSSANIYTFNRKIEGGGYKCVHFPEFTFLTNVETSN